MAARLIQTFGPFTLDEANARLSRDGQAIELVPKAFGVLCQLVARPGELVTKDELLDAVWGRRFVSDSVLKSAVKTLRARLDDDAQAPRLIETVNRRGYRFIASVAAAERAPPPAAGVHAGPAPIGLESASTVLRAAWQLAQAGQRRLVLVAGEPGIGKTTLVDHFVAGLAGITVGRGQCVDQLGASTPHLPLFEALNGLCTQNPALPALLRQVAPTALAQLPWHVAAEDRAALHRDVAGAGPDRLLRELGELFDRLAHTAPLLLVLEDLHWSDAATVQLLDHLMRRRGAARLMVIATFRPTELMASDHALADMRREWRLHGLADEHTLEGWSREQLEAFVAARFGLAAEAPDPTLVTALHAHTQGLPLFVASVLDELVDSGVVDAGTGRWNAARGDAATRLPLPANLLGVIERQIDRLDPERRRALALAALCPGEFDEAVLAAALGVEAAVLRTQLDGLVRRQLWMRRTADAQRHDFRHALFRHAFREQLDPAGRLDGHRRLGAALEAHHTSRLHAVAAELGLHAELGDEPARAARFYALAAEQAMRRFAPRHALALTERGLDNARRLPRGAGDMVELGLWTQTMLARVATQGYAAAATTAAARRALAIVRQQPLSPAALPVWNAAWWIEVYAGHTGESASIARELALRAASAELPLARALAANMAGVLAYHGNRFEDAEAALAEALALLGAEPGPEEPGFFPQDPRVEALAHLTQVQELRGHFVAAEASRTRLLALLDDGQHPLSELMGLFYVAYAHRARGEVVPARRLCERGLARMAGHDANPGMAPHLAVLAWAHAVEGDSEHAGELARQARAQQQAQRTRMGASALHSWAASALLASGELQQAREAIDAALAAACDGDNSFGLAETLCLHGQLLWRLEHDLPGAEAALRQSITAARQHGAISFELQACDALASLLESTGRQAEAAALMQPLLQRLDAEPGAPAWPAIRQRQAARSAPSAAVRSSTVAAPAEGRARS